MTKMQTIITMLFLSMLFLFNSSLAADLPDVQEIVDRVDKLYRSASSEGQMEMTIESEDWTRTLKMDIWSEGMDMRAVQVIFKLSS